MARIAFTQRLFRLGREDARCIRKMVHGRRRMPIIPAGNHTFKLSRWKHDAGMTCLRSSSRDRYLRTCGQPSSSSPKSRGFTNFRYRSHGNTAAMDAQHRCSTGMQQSCRTCELERGFSHIDAKCDRSSAGFWISDNLAQIVGRLNQSNLPPILLERKCENITASMGLLDV